MLACLQRAGELPFIHDVSGCALQFLSASGAVVLPGSNVKSAFRQELVQAIVRDVPLCITSGSSSVLTETIAASNSISSVLLAHIKSGMVSCNPQTASLLFPATEVEEKKGKKSQEKRPPPQPTLTRWEQQLLQIIDGADDGTEGVLQPFLPGRCFRSCVSFTVVLVVTCPPNGKTLEPRNAAVALECIG